MILNQKIVSLIIILVLILTFSLSLTVEANNLREYHFKNSEKNTNLPSDDFYFVHITDTHVMHRFLDKGDNQHRFKTVIEHIKSFAKKPAFIVVTGDLVEWGGGIFGTLNYKAFVEYMYKRDGQLYLDKNFSIPVYTTPGNHDYRWFSTLVNYHRIVDVNHVFDNDRYVIIHENLSLFFMDSGHDYLLNPREWVRPDGLHVKGSGLHHDDIEWLKESLKSCESIHKIILMHHPVIDGRDKHGTMLDVIARNRLEFIDLCKQFEIDIVLTGHNHRSSVYDSSETYYRGNINCSCYPTLYVQTDDCKDDCAYRNITIFRKNILLNQCEKVPYNPNTHGFFSTYNYYSIKSQ